MVKSNSNSNLSVSMATSDSPQHAEDSTATTSYVTMEKGPPQIGYATTLYVTMEEGRLPEGSTNVTTATANAASSSATSSLTRTESSSSTTITIIKDELIELFWELMDFNRQRNWKKKVLTVSVAVCTLFVVVDLLFLGNIINGIHTFANWMSLHIFSGTLLYVLLLTCCTLIMIPPSILIFVCGYVYTDISGLAMGIPAAVLASFAGCLLGAVLAFLRARYMMRDLFLLFSKRYKIIRAVDKAIQHHGFRVMLLLRLCPVVPFNGLNYIGGVTAISMEDFVFALIGVLPLILFTVVLGATAESLLVNQQDQDLTVQEFAVRKVQIVVGLLFVMVAVIITLYKAKKELVIELAAEQEAELLAQNVKKAVGNRNHNDPEDYQQDEQVEVTLREGIDDEEWFWFYS